MRRLILSVMCLGVLTSGCATTRDVCTSRVWTEGVAFVMSAVPYGAGLGPLGVCVAVAP